MPVPDDRLPDSLARQEFALAAHGQRCPDSLFLYPPPPDVIGKDAPMALAKHHEEIIERRSRNGALIVYEYQHSSGDRRAAEPRSPLDLSPEKWAEVRAFVHEINERCKQRYATEMTLLYKLNKERTIATGIGFMTKGEASEIADGVLSCEILDLDNVYGGIMVRADYLFISKAKLEAGLLKHGTGLTLNDLLAA